MSDEWIEDDDDQSDSDYQVPIKKMRYNMIEQQRRSMHKALFQEIRTSLPAVTGHASNSEILTEAIRYNVVMKKYAKICERCLPIVNQMTAQMNPNIFDKHLRKKIVNLRNNQIICLTDNDISTLMLHAKGNVQVEALNMLKLGLKIYNNYVTDNLIDENDFNSSDDFLSDSSEDLSDDSSENSSDDSFENSPEDLSSDLLENSEDSLKNSSEYSADSPDSSAFSPDSSAISPDDSSAISPDNSAISPDNSAVLPDGSTGSPDSSAFSSDSSANSSEVERCTIGTTDHVLYSMFKKNKNI